MGPPRDTDVDPLAAQGGVHRLVRDSTLFATGEHHLTDFVECFERESRLEAVTQELF